jgi:hypothetical protein
MLTSPIDSRRYKSEPSHIETAQECYSHTSALLATR